MRCGVCGTVIPFTDILCLKFGKVKDGCICKYCKEKTVKIIPFNTLSLYDVKQQFITKEDYMEYPDFRFNFTDIGQGVGYKANTSGYNWKAIPDNVILYIPECYAGTCGCKASYVYTKSDLEKCINDRIMDDEHFIDAETMYDELSWEMPEDFLDGLDFDYKKISYCIGDKLYYNLNEFDSPAHSLLVTVTEVNEDNIVCKDSTGISYMFDEDMLDCLTNNPIYPVKKIKIKDSFEKDI